MSGMVGSFSHRRARCNTVARRGGGACPGRRRGAGRGGRGRRRGTDGRGVVAVGCGGRVRLVSYATCSFVWCCSERQGRRGATNRTWRAGSAAAASGRRAAPLALSACGPCASLRRARASSVAQTSTHRRVFASSTRPCRPVPFFLSLCASLAAALAEHRPRRNDKARAVGRCDTFSAAFQLFRFSPLSVTTAAFLCSFCVILERLA